MPQSKFDGLTPVSPELFEGYAALLVEKGAALKKGQELVVQAPVEAAEFARLVVKKAYEAGSGPVTLIYHDDVVSRLTYDYNPVEYFEKVPAWAAERMNEAGRKGAAFIFLEGSDPSALKGVDPAKPAAARKARNTEMKDYRDAVDFGKSQWQIAGVSTPKWAQTVFPDLPVDQAVNALWHAILSTARADNANPQAAWDQHKAAFDANKKFMNEMHFDRLHYTNSLGTDLYVGLTDKHLWNGGGAETVDGTYFFPNMPTEEVFTSPDLKRTEGIVYSALPLVLNGNIVDGFWFRFEGGKIVDHGAKQGKEVLDHLLATDEGARYLGECALVPKESPIKQSGLLFFSTLYDENASCHLATGMGFPDCYEGGLEMDKEALKKAGVNDSATHVDFMIGTDDLQITGITKDGREVPVFVDGTWAPRD